MKTFPLFLVLFSIISFAQSPLPKTTITLNKKLNSVSDNSKVLVWIFFNDKGNDLNNLYSAPTNVVSQLSLKRREKVLDKSSLINFTDLPVSNNYITTLQSQGFELKQRSRWFNGVSGYITKKDFYIVLNFPFVNQADIVCQFKTSPEINEPDQNINKYSPGSQLNKVFSLDYGPSLTQNQQINVSALHDLGYNGQGVTICVMDAGVSMLNHEAFSTMHIIATYDFVNHRTYIGNGQGGHGDGSHGTMTLSAIGGYKPGSIIGPAYGSDYLLAKTENTDSETPVEEDNWIAAMEWAVSIGVDVTSTSLGYLAFDDSVSQYNYTWQNMDGQTARITKGAVLAERKGIVVVNAAGNEGDNSTHNTLIAPADADSIITAGAVTNTGVRSSFSSVGNTIDGRTKPDVMAMGSNVYLANPSTTNTYVTGSGTSFSCPLTAGVCALLLSYNPGLTPMQVRDALRNTASQNTSPDHHMGWGIINALAASQVFPLPLTLTLTALIEGFFNTGTIVSDTVTVELHNSSSPYALVESKKGVLNTAGVGTFNFATVVNGTPYYIVVKHRNAIETWSSAGNSFTFGLLSYDFTSSQSQAYGSNLVLKDGKYCIYSGDINHDNNVNLLDLIAVDNDNTNIIKGYVNTDVNGDNNVNLLDLILVDNNNSAIITRVAPPGALVSKGVKQ